VVAAAAKLEVAMTEHAVVLEPAGAAVGKIDAKLEELRRNGGLGEFNRRYRAARIAAEATGQRVVLYNIALARLRRALGEAAAGGAMPDMAKVLDVP
jgi:hypothetical protein